MNEVLQLLDEYLLHLTKLLEIERKVTDILKKYEEN